MSDTNTTTTTEPTQSIPNATSQPQGKTWTDEYVSSLRDEAKQNRLKAKALEAKFKAFIGLKEDDDLDDAKIEGFKANIEKEKSDIMSKANQKLLKASIKSLDGYDAKLLDKLIMSDVSKVTFDDDGEATNLSDLAEEIAKEFPAVKVAASTPRAGAAANPPLTGTSPTLEEEYTAALKNGNLPLAVALKNKMLEKK